MSEPHATPANQFEVRFHSLFHSGRGLSFPCDSDGRVDLTALPQAARRNYLAACNRIGRDFAPPRVQSQSDLH